ncbi:MAG: hypothetical protein ACLFMM_04755 [Methanohalobium sp.]|uniref:DUF7139 domain-containing protein n=1 Tax=Methanohalobium sp. TaxID=2837493 RepID=UPI0039786CF5
MDNYNIEGSLGLLRRGTSVYYAGSVIFAAGIVLLIVGVAFIIMSQLHYGSEPGKIILSVIFMGGGASLVLTGINLMIKQTRYGYHVTGMGIFLAFLALTVFTSIYPQGWYYPTVSYVLAMYVVGILALLGNGFANVVLWIISSKSETAVKSAQENYTIHNDESIQRDLEEAVQSSIQQSSSELKFKDQNVGNVRLGKAFRETSGKTTRVKDDINEADKLKRTTSGDKVKSGSAEVEKISTQLREAMENQTVEKGVIEKIKERLERYF